MTKPLPRTDVQIQSRRLGPPRLTAPERQALASVEDEALRKVLGEAFIQARSVQENFDEIRQWFPVQPQDVAQAVLGSEGPEGPEGKEGPPGASSETRTILGLIGREGEVLAGEGFKVEQLGTGKYRITYDEPFVPDPSGAPPFVFVLPQARELIPEAPYILLTPNWESVKDPQGECRVHIKSPGNEYENSKFYFMATDGLAGLEGPAGADGRTLLSGVGAPSEIGEDGDFYIDTENSEIYGPKFEGAWGEGVDLIGPQGPKGDAGEKGAKGDTGEKGEKGEKGAKGDTGEKGAKGDTGSEGPKGLEGPQGEKGVKGDTGENGEKGDTGAKGEKGDTGEKGAAGEKGATGEKGEKGATGEKGSTGEAGRAAGLKYTYLTNTEETDPASGKLKFNKATLSEATSLRISETDGDSNSLAAYLAAWDDSTSTIRGHLTIRKDSDPSVFTIFSISGTITDKGTWDTFTVAYVAGSTSITNETPVKVEFRPKGDKGDTGEKGEKGSTGEKGETGAKGETGSAGPEGAAGKGIIACRLSRLAGLPAYTRTGNKLEANENGPLPALFDGVVPAVNDYFLFKTGAAEADNGPYKITSLGSGESKWRMERVPELDTSAEAIPGMLVTVAEGVRHADRQFKLTTNAVITLNTTPLTFALVTPRDFGLVEALPTSEALVGDLCTYKADGTNGVFWQFVYDGEGEFPWKKIGGPPLPAPEILSLESTESTSYVNLATTGPKVTIPLGGDYLIHLGGFLVPLLLTTEGLQSFAVGGTAASDNDAVRSVGTAGGAGSSSGARIVRKAGIGAGAEIVTKYRVTGGKVQWGDRWLTIDPIRVG